MVGTDVAAAVMLQGMTAHYLVNSICTFNEGDWVLDPSCREETS
jgi:hypothetical protein